jgi:6,7-dimethyl-8-ribityllumazine synthase
MVTPLKRDHELSDMALASGPDVRVMIIHSPYYGDVSAELMNGAAGVLQSAGVSGDRYAVPGALEIPQAFAQAVAAGLFAPRAGGPIYKGVIALGCVIRGETAHYDIVCNNTNHWMMETAIRNTIPLGNGVLTVDTHAQALARAQGGPRSKGADAARACLRLIWLPWNFEQQKLRFEPHES